VTDSGDDGVPAAESRDVGAGERAGQEVLRAGQAEPRRPPQKPERHGQHAQVLGGTGYG
jgi:hypothetical protein